MQVTILRFIISDNLKPFCYSLRLEHPMDFSLLITDNVAHFTDIGSIDLSHEKKRKQQKCFFFSSFLFHYHILNTVLIM